MKRHSALLTRRGFLSAFLTSMGAGALSLWLPDDHKRRDATLDGFFLSACDGPDGRHFITACNRNGREQFRLEVPQRMHGIALNPGRPQQAVFFARRPGTDIYSVDLRSGTVMQKLLSRPGRHFCGHGCFSTDGQYLFVSENDHARNRGVISVRDAATLAVLDEWPSHGRDPHEIRLLGKGTLVVANGGILTSPDRPGANLAPEAMQPSLVYLDTADGKIRGEFRLPDLQLSIRHIDVNDEGLVAIALQYEGAASDKPLLASHAGEDKLRLFAADACDWRRLNRYTGSIAFAGGNSPIAAVSSPRGNCLGFWDMAEQRMLAQHYIRDVCGIGYDARHRSFVASTGEGVVHRFDAEGRMMAGGRLIVMPETRWDNHLILTT